MKKGILLLVAAVFALSACTGSFNLTQKVYDIHSSQEDQWVDEALFLALWIIPVYEIAIAGDLLIFNSIEFWTGDNPITVDSGDSEALRVSLSRSGTDRSLAVTAVGADGREISLTLKETEAGMTAFDEAGNVVFVSVPDDAGGLAVRDANGDLLRYFTPEEVRGAIEGAGRLLAR
jgi:hypothetical protein